MWVASVLRATSVDLNQQRILTMSVTVVITVTILSPTAAWVGLVQWVAVMVPSWSRLHLEKWRQPLTPSRRQHDTTDGEELVFNLRPKAHSTKSFSRKTSCLFLLTVWTTYNIQIPLHSQLTLPNVAENIKPLGSKPERAPSCLWQHSGPPQPRTKPASLPAFLSSPTSVSYINFTSS